ncbi:site-specific integrase [Halomicroarcula sp. F28]|uniref:phage integrase SAM-like domain-containing protein n=1 Tax=Haloarcula salinisoli TaxID=2487746 RepID=UPI001C72A0A6|nr:phage integrase SAM-like domain-containing protein [Halomicroarcula salinisoli]MBX0288557.1 site-specific integrase [Halomicroarcula salinisoli]
MCPHILSDRARRISITESIERYLQDKGKGRGGDGGNYRRNAARELARFAQWAAGDRGRNEWTGILPEDVDRDPTFQDLDERVFRAYARYLGGDRALKQNTIHTYYHYISAWCGWCANEGYLEGHYARRASAMAPLPEDDGRKPGDQQIWTPEQRHTLIRHVDSRVHDAIETYRTLPEDVDSLDRQRARYTILKAARDRALVFVIAYTAVRVGEILRDPNDPRRRGVQWGEISLDDGSMDVYRKKQQWDVASLPGPVIAPLRSYRRLMDPPTVQWPVFPTFDQRTLATLVQDELGGIDAIEGHRDEYARDFLVALDEGIHPPSITTDGARSILQRLSDEAEVDIEHPKHDYLSPHGGRRGMGEILVRSFGYTVAARYLDNSEKMIRKRYSHIEADELGELATEAINETDCI